MRSATYVRALLALAAALLLSLSVLSAPAGSAAALETPAPAVERQAAQRAGCSVPNCWKAISFNTRTGYSGWVAGRRGVRTKAAAIRIALDNCRSRAENRRFKSACANPNARNTFVRNGCLAVAFRRNGNRIVEWGKGVAFHRAPAERKARRVVAGAGQVFISAWVCTLRKK